MTANASFAAYWERIRLRIQGDFRQWIPELFDGLPDAEMDAVLRSMEAGKRIRGCLVCLACEALGGDVEAAIPRAVAIECLHAASLIHDDVVDGDAERRDRPAEWALQGSRRAVLLGDVMFSTVIHKMVEHSMEEGSLVARVIATMAKGAYQEHFDRSALERPAGDERPRADIYEDIIHLKTGVLFGAAAQLGAMAAMASEPARARAFKFGARLGAAYQMADDLVDVVELEPAGRADPAALAAAAPILLRFSAMTPSELSRLINTSHRERRFWAETKLPLIKQRMRAEIAARCATAISVLGGFPNNDFTRLLREMPADIVRSMDATDPVRPSGGD